jgi:hypothetical protein
MSLPRYAVCLEGLAVFAADGQAVLFDSRDSGLHLLAELPWAVVEALQILPCNALQLKQRLQDEYPDDDALEQSAAIDIALEQLLDIGLIQKVAP